MESKMGYSFEWQRYKCNFAISSNKEIIQLNRSMENRMHCSLNTVIGLRRTSQWNALELQFHSGICVTKQSQSNQIRTSSTWI